MSHVERRLELDEFVRDERAWSVPFDSVVDAAGIVAGLRAAESLQLLACRSSATFDTVDVLAELLDQRDDQLAAIAGVHALSGVPGSLATAVLDEALDDERWFVTEHAAWSFSARSPHRPAMDRLASMVTDGGFRGMVAQRTLAGWADGDGNGVLAALRHALERAEGAGRVALIDAVSAVPGAAATALLERVADGDDADAQRASRHWDGGRATRIPSHAWPWTTPTLGEIAFLALIDKTLSTRTTDVTPSQTRRGSPDRSGRHPRRVRRATGPVWRRRQRWIGHTREPTVHRVHRPRRRRLRSPRSPGARPATQSPMRSSAATTRSAWHQCPSAAGRPIDRRSSWEHRLAVERGIRRVFLAGARPDVVHLRMADVGTLAAGRVARQLGIPVVFTAAPDPHVVLGQLDPAKVSRWQLRRSRRTRALLVPGANGGTNDQSGCPSRAAAAQRRRQRIAAGLR